MNCPECKHLLTETKEDNKVILYCNKCKYLSMETIPDSNNNKENNKQYDLFGNISKTIYIKDIPDELFFQPFSVLDTKQGIWNNRKREWKKLFKKDFEGRKKSLAYSSAVGASINEGTSVFDPVLCELSYKWFCPAGGTILDPFAGGAVRGIVAEKSGFKYTGIDLSEEQIKTNKAKANALNIKPNYIVGNSLNIDKLIDNNLRFDFIYTCPPYYNLEHYTEDNKDLSNYSTYNNFLKDYSIVIKKSLDKLKDDRFAGIIVSNFRDNDGFVINFVGDTIRIFEENNIKLYNDAIFLQPIGTASIRSKSIFKYKKLTKVHQHLLIFYRGNVSKIM